VLDHQSPEASARTRCPTRYLEELDAKSVTRQIDLAVAAQAEQDDSAGDAVAMWVTLSQMLILYIAWGIANNVAVRRG
jgi:hypothetical protein